MRLIIILICLPLKFFCQTQLNETQLEELKRNIISYSIRFSNNDKYNDFYPQNGWTLDLKVEKIISSEYEIKDSLDYFKVINNNFTFKQINGIMISEKLFSHVTPKYFKLSRFSLIALNKKNELLFLGGNFYKSSIAYKFNLPIKDETKFYDFIKIKLYNYKVDNLKKIRHNKNYLFFVGFSNVLQKDIKIKINKLNFDDIIVVDE